MADSRGSIAYVHTGHWPSNSPSTVFVTGTVWGLSNHAHCRLLIRNGSDETTETIFERIAGTPPPESLTIDRAAVGTRAPGHGRFFRAAYTSLAAQASTGSLDAVITRNIGFLPYLTRFRRKYGILCLFETHDFFGNLSFRTDLKRSLNTWKRSLFERRYLPRLDGIICLTEPQRHLFRDFYPSIPTVVAPTGLFSVHRPPDEQREKTLCYVGSLDPHKGLGVALDALSMLSDRSIQLHVIGGKTEQEKHRFMELANLCGVADRVRITTWLHHSDVAYHLDRSIAGLVPLRDTPFNQTITSPLKILDCFSRCLPVIASDLPSTRHYVTNGRHGLLFRPDDAADCARAIEELVGSDMVGRCADDIASDAPNLNWITRGKTILEFIRSLKRAT